MIQMIIENLKEDRLKKERKVMMLTLLT